MAATIDRLLIANRGEIAVRIARTARRLGISPIGVHSEADRGALHTRTMDRSVSLGGSTPAESYLRVDAIVAAALATGCDAVHPGYGFLAENPAAARAVEAAGLIWVGPTPEQIELRGDKIAAKRAAVAAGVPTTTVHTVDPAGPPPEGVAMPALVKAAAGGGGRGMRVVHRAEDLAGAIEAAGREALAAFGDPTVFIEPYIEHGRHIEVQIMADSHGSVIHLGERDCSVQRRNQKVVEEAPAPGLEPTVRDALRSGAVSLARHVGYRGAGTVEFLLGPDGTITFLEVNTRLQVEHPVTEAITGLDLVEMQLAIAAGHPLPLGQDDIRFDGHAIEARVVAEDPASGWLPSTGRIDRFEIGDGVRVDSGVEAGSVVTTDYDSLLAKVIAHGPDRDTARRRLRAALRSSEVDGVRTNIDMLVALLDDDDFAAGRLDTGLLARSPDILNGSRPTGDDLTAHLMAVVASVESANRSADRHWGEVPSGWRNVRTRGTRVVLMEDGGPEPIEHRVEYEIVTRAGREDHWKVLLGDWPEPDEKGALPADERRSLQFRRERRAVTADSEVVFVEIDGLARTVTLAGRGSERIAVDPTGRTRWMLRPRFVDHESELVGSGPVAPLPGTVIAVAVEAGQNVEADQVLMVVEAMKMEHQITAPAAGVVSEVRFAVGDRVDMGDLLVVLDTGESS
ncbi:MAG: biotin carboxylase N-terminal domain-containing protein [Ilumatobacteraceae bacterium]